MCIGLVIGILDQGVIIIIDQNLESTACKFNIVKLNASVIILG